MARWTTVAVALSAVALVLVTPARPAAAVARRTLSFSGYTWTVKSNAHRLGPGPNYFSKKNAWVDSLGRLHLVITKAKRHWTVGEVVNTRSLGYGTYTWVLDSRVDDLDPDMVLGLFTYDWTSPQFNYREIDIEASRWGDPFDPTNAQFVVQPYAHTGNLTRVTLGSSLPTTLSFHWTASGLSFSAPGASPSSWTYTGADRPPAGGEVPDINFWLRGGHAPMNGHGAEVVVRSFTFTPG
ncbi:MAG TPA: hypothetical protein VMV22_09810 [Acidimicrobiales bacterium]|nr:hypothetical protein [Acidimicrobiales bacterium]